MLVFLIQNHSCRIICGKLCYRMSHTIAMLWDLSTLTQKVVSLMTQINFKNYVIILLKLLSVIILLLY